MEIKELQSYNALSVFHQGEYRKLERLFKAHGSWSSAWGNSKVGSRISLEREWKELERGNVALLSVDSPEFPPLLKEIPWLPFGLYTRGIIPEKDPKIAIVGTRKATSHGISIARQFGKELGNAGITTVSGLALGVDAAAHEGTLEAGGKTIAVLANGLHTIYPRQNEKIGKKIIESGGALVSEYPLGSPSLPQRFLERNRIVSGLSRGVIVIEAPTRSGALSTARFALEQNREVFVAPGPVSSPNYEGSHALIKEGATLITNVKDVFDALNITAVDKKKRSTQRWEALDGNQKIILNVLHAEGKELTPEAIAQKTNLSLSKINEELSILIVEGLVEEKAGKYHIT